MILALGNDMENNEIRRGKLSPVQKKAAEGEGALANVGPGPVKQQIDCAS